LIGPQALLLLPFFAERGRVHTLGIPQSGHFPAAIADGEIHEDFRLILARKIAGLSVATAGKLPAAVTASLFS
jgi:hypothetical protein